jgi:EAL domain-containing protein (putative c-di-GMP-specific phosphodiesterase class I)
MAMYRAKAAGRNNYQFYLPSMNERAMQRMDMEHRLRMAMDRGQITAFYQPKVHLKTGAITGMEALARWRLPGGSMIEPNHFIPLAEETGLIIPLGEHILHLACAQAREWRDAGLGGMPVAVNLSTRQLLQRPTGRNARYNLIEIVNRALDTFHLPPSALELEVTESAFLKDVDLGISILGRLHDLGVPIAIDDFGTGFSSLNYLKMLPARKIKVDRSFVRMLNQDGPDATIVNAIISMAHGLGMKVVAEGVETLEQFHRLRAMQCDEMQGYLVSGAVDGDSATKLLGKMTKRAA